jgi:hypothetical protein
MTVIPRKRRIGFGLLCCIGLVGPVALADEYITGNESPYAANPQRYDRFYSGPDKAFIGAGLDFSGVAGGGPWATMISSQYFITAYHFPANNDSTLTFYEGNSTSAGAHTYRASTTSLTTTAALRTSTSGDSTRRFPRAITLRSIRFSDCRFRITMPPTSGCRSTTMADPIASAET